ncbi:NAD(P)-dependent alcohol dehydrogenase [Accumulibacter sp.]|uniref:NADPH-dependent aldehyde reductase Ahr n=1 Tax=Accumulibacter sp. TaxID=2053492 RepID=UPI0025F8D335|nr:NAD(P)-dependent alcohol dehydrogenase [Accumulibacter sp.]MCM8595960.1 NAD(P)-dependent alcohol dehydrogenase [Accumulibacter sp.]MCM8625214.1 NAD(P)-dependent alcohol dehydrogenase [Accumulibacter sp.]MDS4050109.1 NAD(P)-dependent alcohol dehydrogenase [Accumulibacter sp.]
MIRAYAADKAGGPLKPFSYDPGELGPHQVEIDVLACGVCHSDLSMLDDEWRISAYPFVPGHEVVGRVARKGNHVRHLETGDTVGLGWFSGCCMTCNECLGGHHNLCRNNEQTIVGRFGGFADKVRCNGEWAFRLPAGVDPRSAGPLFCGGITVFGPIVEFGVSPTDRAGVIGIGGLGHLALQFLNKWGCEVTAFTTTDAKRDEALAMGAHRVVNLTDAAQLEALAGSLDFVLSTVNADLDWSLFLRTLAPGGRLHVVGAVPSPIPVPAFALIGGQKSVSGSPVGSPATTRRMLEFCARHRIAPITEYFPMSRVNEALQHLASGKARYRVVLENDFA